MKGSETGSESTVDFVKSDLVNFMKYVVSSKSTEIIDNYPITLVDIHLVTLETISESLQNLPPISIQIFDLKNQGETLTNISKVLNISKEALENIYLTQISALFLDVLEIPQNQNEYLKTLIQLLDELSYSGITHLEKTEESNFEKIIKSLTKTTRTVFEGIEAEFDLDELIIYLNSKATSNETFNLPFTFKDYPQFNKIVNMLIDKLEINDNADRFQKYFSYLSKIHNRDVYTPFSSSEDIPFNDLLIAIRQFYLSRNNKDVEV